MYFEVLLIGALPSSGKACLREESCFTWIHTKGSSEANEHLSGLSCQKEVSAFGKMDNKYTIIPTY